MEHKLINAISPACPLYAVFFDPDPGKLWTTPVVCLEAYTHNVRGSNRTNHIYEPVILEDSDPGVLSLVFMSTNYVGLSHSADPDPQDFEYSINRLKKGEQLPREIDLRSGHDYLNS